MQENLKDTQREIQEIFEEYKGLSFDEIAFEIGLNPKLITSKVSMVTLVNALFRHKNFNWKSLQDKEFNATISLKTIRLNSNGNPAESMSFEQVRFMDLVEENWQTSVLRNKFQATTFLFVVFQYERGRPKKPEYLLFKGMKLWKMPLETLDIEMKRLWELTRNIVMDGVELEEVKNGQRIIVKNNLPGIKDSPVAHIRPKARDANDKTELPCGQFIVKQAYWLNNGYIGEVLSDLPDIERNSSEIINGLQTLSPAQLMVLQSTFREPIYTIEDFYEKASHKIQDFSRFHINKSNLSKIGYKITSHFIVAKEISSVDQYFEDIILKNDYFIKPESTIFESPYFKRKIENLENAFQIFEIEDKTYITNKKLQQANIEKEMFVDYKESVEDYVESERFFTLSSLESNGFSHVLNEYGFDPLFYENILKRPGRLKFIKIAKQHVFMKTPQNINVTDFIRNFMDADRSLSVDELLSRINDSCNLSLQFEYLEGVLKEVDLFYSEEMKKIFVNEEAYYSEVYD